MKGTRHSMRVTTGDITVEYSVIIDAAGTLMTERKVIGNKPKDLEVRDLFGMLTACDSHLMELEKVFSKYGEQVTASDLEVN